jgi:tetratricopeptide (TPR) repeat protein
MKKLLLLFAVQCLGWGMSPVLANIPVPQVSEIKKMPVKSVVEKAQELYRQEDFRRAYYYYYALSQMKKKLSKEETYRLGLTALQASEPAVAEQYLSKLLFYKRRFPHIEFDYARALKNKGDYKKALVYFQSYLKKHQKDGLSNPNLSAARYHVQGCETAIKTQSYAQYSISSGINSTAEQVGTYRSMTHPSIHGYKLVEYQTEQGICIRKVSPQGEILPLKGKAGNPAFNSGAPFMAHDGQTVLFSCQETMHNGNMESKIYMGRINEQGDVVDIKKLGPAINPDGYSSLYPTLSVNEKGQEVLYFSSNIPGGEGGYDIWYSVRMTNGEFTRPYNLGRRINSGNDEITPYYHNQTNELFFSSDKPEGFGGFDVYKMNGTKQNWNGAAAQHLAYPINSHGNDYHFILDENGQAQLTTNREGKKDKTIQVNDTDKARAIKP